MKAFILFLDFSTSRNVMWHTTYLHLHYDVTYLKIHRLLYTILVACYSRMILYSEEFLKTTNTSAAMTHFSLRQWHPNLWTRWSEALGNCNQRATATIWRKERFPVGFLLNASIFILFWLNCVHHHGPLNTAGWHLRSHTQHIAVFAQSSTSSKVSGSALWRGAVLSSSLGGVVGTGESVAGKGELRKSITVMTNHSHSSSPAKHLCLCKS